jgi:hypothetical protein
MHIVGSELARDSKDNIACPSTSLGTLSAISSSNGQAGFLHRSLKDILLHSKAVKYLIYVPQFKPIADHSSTHLPFRGPQDRSWRSIMFRNICALCEICG